jgi:hypothetical protein
MNTHSHPVLWEKVRCSVRVPSGDEEVRWFDGLLADHH